MSMFTAQPKAPASMLFKTTGDQRGKKKIVIIITRRVSEGFTEILAERDSSIPH
jgi:hypothetical protein